MLELADLTAGWPGRPVLERVNLTLGEGEAVLLVGPNNAGKSTLIRTIAGLLPAMAGRILWHGADITRRPFHDRAGIALVPEGRILAPRLTVAETLLLGAAGAPTREVSRRRDAVLARLPLLADRLGQAAGTLSGGEAQMLSLGRALMSAPRLLLLDEPTLGLSPAAARTILGSLAQMRADGLAMVLSDQDARAVAALSDRTFLLADRGLTLQSTKKDALP